MISKLRRLSVDFPFNQAIICFVISLVSVYYEITRIKRIAFAPNCRTVSSVISDNAGDYMQDDINMYNVLKLHYTQRFETFH